MALVIKKTKLLMNLEEDSLMLAVNPRGYVMIVKVQWVMSSTMNRDYFTKAGSHHYHLHLIPELEFAIRMMQLQASPPEIMLHLGRDNSTYGLINPSGMALIIMMMMLRMFTIRTTIIEFKRLHLKLVSMLVDFLLDHE